MDQKKIDRINALYHKSKAEGLMKQRKRSRHSFEKSISHRSEAI